VAGQAVSSFARLLRQLRAEAGLTQEELAAAAGLGLRTVSDLERGAHRTAHQDTARLLADALGLTDPAYGLFVAVARGQAEAAQVLAARADALAAVSAPVAGVPVPRELPADVGAFTGRELELAELDLLLPSTAGQERVMGPVVISAVSGTAGVGKTALAVRWAHRAAESFQDGQLYVNLRGYDPDQPVAPGEALAGFLRALGIPDQSIPLGESERAARYRSLVAGKRLLVVLDNAATVEQVRPLLPGTSSVMVVVTSRDSLAGLVARDGARRLDLDLLPAAEAIALLRTLIGGRAEADPAATETLAGQCARLPLALRVAAELAASRPEAPLAVLSAELVGLRQRLQLLDAGGDPRSAVAGVFSWSYRHLPADAARLFRLLGLHPSQDWDQYAAAALTATTGLPRVRQLLDILARAHLIQPIGTGRYQMHDLLRAYAASQATDQDSTEARRAALTRLFDYYLVGCATATDCLSPANRRSRPDPPPGSTPVPDFSDRAAAQAWLDTELPTVVSVTEYTAGHGWPDHTGRLASTLHTYICIAGYYTEGIIIATCALEAARGAGDRAAQSGALRRLGNYYSNQGRTQQGIDCTRQAVALARELDDRLGQAHGHYQHALAQLLQGRYQHSARSFRQARSLYHELGDQASESEALSGLGQSYLWQGRYQQAASQLREALAVARKAGHEHGEAEALHSLGEVCWRLDHYQQATEYGQQALTISRDIGDRYCEAEALTVLSRVCHRLGLYDQAKSHQRRALELYQEFNDRRGQAMALNGAGETLLCTGQHTQAHDRFTAALTLARQVGNQGEQGRALSGLGVACHRQGHYDQAAGYHQQALVLYQDIGDRGGQAEALNATGENLLATGQPGQASECHTTALTLTRQTGERYQQARAHRGLGAACYGTGQMEQARQHWQHALDIYTELGVPETADMHVGPASPADTALTATTEMPTTAAQ
jgi:tetratricopeptide (TPR) repeat protein